MVCLALSDKLDGQAANPQIWLMTAHNVFEYFKTSPKIIRLALMYYVRAPLRFRQVKDILLERGIDIYYALPVRYCH